MIQDLVRQPADLVRGGMLHDNNHLLNSAWMYLLGPHLPAVLYRLPAVVAGTAAVYAAWLFGRTRSPASAVACAGLVAIDHVLVHAGSEARGYGVLTLAVIAAQVTILAGFGHQAAHAESGGEIRFGQIVTGPAVVFNLAALTGFLSHLTFVSCYGAALIWSVWRSGFDTERPLGRRLATIAVWHAAPLMLLAVLALGFVRGMDYGRGPSEARDRIGVASLGQDVVRGDSAAGGGRDAIDVAGHLRRPARGLHGRAGGQSAGGVVREASGDVGLDARRGAGVVRDRRRRAAPPSRSASRPRRSAASSRGGGCSSRRWPAC